MNVLNVEGVVCRSHFDVQHLTFPILRQQIATVLAAAAAAAVVVGQIEEAWVNNLDEPLAENSDSK